MGRLTGFIKLADYLIATTMHALAKNSTIKVLENISSLVQITPTDEEIKVWRQIELNLPDEQNIVEDLTKENLTLSEEEEPINLEPLFITELDIQSEGFQFYPSIQSFQSQLADILNKLQDTVLSVSSLVIDNYFNAFTTPNINGKFEEKTCGEGPKLSAMFDDDKQLHSFISGVHHSVGSAFKSADCYVSTLTSFHEFFVDNEAIDLNSINYEDLDIEWFEEKLSRFTNQHESALS